LPNAVKKAVPAAAIGLKRSHSCLSIGMRAWL
jgi:hypothetical protein